ncbi:MAG: NADP-dependent malic enzyme [Gemmatimonadota bacterium]
MADRGLTGRDEILAYHARGRPGKLEVVASKPCLTQRDLSLAYTPGVAVPCLEIQRDPSLGHVYTGRGNLVAVVTNGSAVLGLGNIGPLASKPVMEGKAVLFKRFADIDVFDIELDSQDPDEIVRAVQLLEPTFGGINLEDIKAPECFYIEEKLAASLSIPVFHDDQHGTAIVSGAALLNALELTGREIAEARVVYSGAGAGGLACAAFHQTLGVRPGNVLVCDRNGVIHRGRREGMNPYKARFAADTARRTLAEALEGADVFIGLSCGGTVTAAMLQSMAPRPLVFALANPEPEIPYQEAVAARPDAIVATGRSDHPNQVNNVLVFPALFRGALDVRARRIDDAMKVAAVRALAALAREETPEEVLRAYHMERLAFGPEYILPKPFDPRVALRVAPAVAAAAVASGAAPGPLDAGAYRRSLAARLGTSREIVRVLMARAAGSPRRIVFPEGTHPRVLRACKIISEEGIARPVVLGIQEEIRRALAELQIAGQAFEIVDPLGYDQRPACVEELFRLRGRKGMTRADAAEKLGHRHWLGPMMVHMGYADGLIGGLIHHYSDTLRPALQIIGVMPHVRRVAGLYVMLLKGEALFFADATVNIEPTAEDLAEIAVQAAAMAREFSVEPRVAMLSFSNFGSSSHPLAAKVRRAVELVHDSHPSLCIDGEMAVDTALNPEQMAEFYPFSRLQERANVLIFPDLQSANVGYKLVSCLGGAEAMGPILMGLKRPVHLLQQSATVNQIVQMTALAVVDAQERERLAMSG